LDIKDLIITVTISCYQPVPSFDEGLWQQWPLPSTEISFWHITAHSLIAVRLMTCLLMARILNLKEVFN